MEKIKNVMDMMITFVKDKNMAQLAYSSEERASTNEGGNTLPLHPSCGKIQKGSKERSVKTWSTPTLR
jgi:hypothetical protein